MIQIDSNVLLYATVPGFEEHRVVLDHLRQGLAGGNTYCLAWMTVFEYLRTSTHPKFFRPEPVPLKKALANVDWILRHPSVLLVEPGQHHLETFERLSDTLAPVSGNFVHDCRLAAIMLENGVRRIVTRDRDFHRIPGIQVIDPTR